MKKRKPRRSASVVRGLSRQGKPGWRIRWTTTDRKRHTFWTPSEDEALAVCESLVAGLTLDEALRKLHDKEKE